MKKSQFIHYQKAKDFEIEPLSNQKQYKYDLLLYKSINYENKKDLCLLLLRFCLFFSFSFFRKYTFSLYNRNYLGSQLMLTWPIKNNNKILISIKKCHVKF